MTARSTTPQRILERIGHLCDYILFDEAWAGFMKFHPLFEGRFAMGLKGLERDLAGHHRHPVDAQAARQLLAGLADPRARPPHQGPARRRRASALQRRLHAARLDLAVLSAVRLARRRRADDEGPVGRGAVGRHHPARHRTAQEAARGPARVRGEGERPGAALVLRSVRARRVSIRDAAQDGAIHDVPWESVPTDLLARDPRYWALAPGAAWHGFTALEDGFAMTDPDKLTLLTPGFDRRTGDYEAHGIPAPVVAQYLRENRVVAEKNDLNSHAVPADAGRRIEQGRHAGLGAGRLQAAARRQCAARRGDAGIRRQAAGALSRHAAARPLRRDARLLSATTTSAGLQKAQFAARAPARDGDDAARGAAPAHAQQGRLRAARSSSRAGSRRRCSWSIRRASRRSCRASGSTSARGRCSTISRCSREAPTSFPDFEAEIQGLYREMDDPAPFGFYTYVVRE